MRESQEKFPREKLSLDGGDCEEHDEEACLEDLIN